MDEDGHEPEPMPTCDGCDWLHGTTCGYYFTAAGKRCGRYEPLKTIRGAAPAETVTIDQQIKHMVGRFLAWPLPEGFNPDGGITFDPVGSKGTPHEFKRQPVGTNLLTAIQATAMVRHMLEGLPAAPTPADLRNAIAKVALPPDVVKLVDAARKVAYDEYGDFNLIAELGEAVEAFASRVPWEDEPTVIGIDLAAPGSDRTVEALVAPSGRVLAMRDALADKVLITNDDGLPGGYVADPAISTLHIVPPTTKGYAVPNTPPAWVDEAALAVSRDVVGLIKTAQVEPDRWPEGRLQAAIQVRVADEIQAVRKAAAGGEG